MGGPRAARLTRLVLIAVVAALLAAGCGGDRSPPAVPEDPRRPTVTIASFNFAESQILAELYAQALRGRGYPVEVVPAVGAREIVEPALEQGKADLVPEYMGTALDFLNRGERVATADPARTYQLLRRELARRGVTVLEYAPVENRNGYVVAAATARRNGLRRISDLSSLASRLTFGGPPECPARPLCLKGLEDLYGLRFARFQPMPSREVTAVALTTREIDVGMIETTDGSLATHDLVQLEDDRRLQPAENIVPAVRTQVLRAYGEPLAGVLNAVTRALVTPELIGMNRRVQQGEEPAAAVAADWLREHHLG